MSRRDFAATFPVFSTTNFDELLNDTRSQWTMRDEGSAGKPQEKKPRASQHKRSTGELMPLWQAAEESGRSRKVLMRAWRHDKLQLHFDGHRWWCRRKWLKAWLDSL